MRIRHVLPFAALLAAPPAPAAVDAQTRDQPTLVLSVGLGGLTGHRLWAVDRQTLVVPGTEGSGAPQYDTLAIRRNVSASFAAGVQAIYYPAPRVGFEADVSYFAFPLDDTCTGIYYHASDTEQRNQQVCDNMSRDQSSGSGIGVYLGANARAAPRGVMSPYVRAGVGLLSYTVSTVEVAAPFTDGTGTFVRSVIQDPDPRRLAVSYEIGAGFSSPIGPGYQFRLEARDVLISMERLDGPANALGRAPTSVRWYHRLALTLGIDIVLERSRGRRY